MFPIQQNNLITTNDFYNHFIIECIPISQRHYSTVLDSSTKIIINLPITIKGSNKETWKIDTYLYGLWWENAGALPINITLNRTGKTNDQQIMRYLKATAISNVDTFSNIRSRHEQVILNFNTQKYALYYVSGQIEGSVQTTNASMGGIGSELDLYDYTNIAITHSGTQKARIRGLYIEFTKLNSAAPYFI